ncbi:hypothetical protein DAEQUDRAFT_470895 [Daedalea quercina L-15889]|uniref:Uncharacterized protein n=1 Tax=Daedalea quercina L-15889 TaxID=1314783 RepID=A0A165MYH2_9APHY|nr:hypothetical protein DAEQUDRAFT_470895 [Daedalea quercina L-15889]
MRALSVMSRARGGERDAASAALCPPCEMACVVVKLRLVSPDSDGCNLIAMDPPTWLTSAMIVNRIRAYIVCRLMSNAYIPYTRICHTASPLTSILRPSYSAIHLRCHYGPQA